MMIEGKWFAPGAAIPEALSLRRQVLGQAEDALDAAAWNVVVYHEGQPAATGRIWWADGTFWLGGIAVPAALRGRKLGDLTLRLLLFKAESHSARMIRTRAPDQLVSFFTRLGFTADGPAVNGLVTLSLRGEDLCLDTCQGCTRDCARRT